MEFIKLSVASKNATYGQKAEHNIKLLHDKYPGQGLLPYFINPQDGGLLNNHITFGAMGDSYYECAPSATLLLFCLLSASKPAA